MKYFSMFSGIGGFELGIGDKAECIGYSEIDKYAIQIYDSHFNHTNYGDATKINADTLPDFDLLVGGFPCQAFSIAGKRKGFEDTTRGTLFFDIARILQSKRPKHFILENVKGLLSHNNGDTFKTIISTLAELGYCVEWQVLNSKNFGVPQNRERVFIVGHLGEIPQRQVFPFSQNSGEDIVVPTLTARYWGGQANGGYISKVTPSLRASNHKRGDNDTLVGTYRTHKDGQGFRESKSGLVPTIPARAREDGSGQAVILEKDKIRRLTPTECERLQGFPDNWTQGVSDTQRYKCLGNAVTVNVVKEVINRLLTNPPTEY